MRDPVHGFIELREKSEVDLVNHPAFQRLRRISQLAMAYLAFPGARHTRFDHSLGVLHVANRLVTALEPGLSPDELTHVRLAALCHDIGHGPFSHISEFAFEACSSTQGETERIHEGITREIVKQVLRPEGILTESQTQEVVSVLSPAMGYRTVLKDAVSGPLDADKLDYLLRDSYFCGVKYGVYDLDRLVSAITRTDDGDASYIGVRADDVPAVDQYALARHNMNQVYYHKVRRVADAMLVRSIVLACEEGNPDVRKTYVVEEVTREYLDHFLTMDDEGLVHRILACPGKPSSELMRRLLDRRLVKEVFREPLYQCGDAGFRESIRTPQGKKELEASLANQCSKADWEVFVDLQQGRPLRKGAGEDGPETIFVIDRRGRRNYDEVSPIFRYGPHREEDYVSVYVPIQGESEGERNQDRSRCEEVARELLRFQADAPRVEQCPRCGKELPARPDGHCKICGLELATKDEQGEEA